MRRRCRTDHFEVIEKHAGGRIVDAVIVHDGPFEEETPERYRDEGPHPLTWSGDRIRDVRVIRDNLLGEGPKPRHDPMVTVEALVADWSSSRAASQKGRLA